MTATAVVIGMRNRWGIIMTTLFFHAALRTVEGFAFVSPRHSRRSGNHIMTGRRFLATVLPTTIYDSTTSQYNSRCFMSSVSPEATPTSSTTPSEALDDPFWDSFCNLDVPEGRVVGLNLKEFAANDPESLEPTAILHHSTNATQHWIYAWLHPDEVAYAATQSSSSRRETFIIGRVALREALKCVRSSGQEDSHTTTVPTECNNNDNHMNDHPHHLQNIPPILKDNYGRPTMPPGYVGSISHKDRAGVGIVARDTTASSSDDNDGARQYYGIGIDLERTTNPRRNIARRVLTEHEIESLGQLEGVTKEEEVMLRFSLKECIYKAVHPLICQYVGFQEAEVTPHDDGTASVDWMLKSGAQVRLGEVTAHWQRLEGGEFFLSSSSAFSLEGGKEVR